MAKTSEWDVLRKHHRFVRDDEQAADVSWEERLARAYESKLFREYALIDLKHFKSKRFALRWRTASEVVNGIGEETCGGLRCDKHTAPCSRLDAFELPFVYQEGGEVREVVVKVRLCPRCAERLEWKPREERAREDRAKNHCREKRDRDGEPANRAGDRRKDRHDRREKHVRNERHERNERNERDSDRNRHRAKSSKARSTSRDRRSASPERRH